MEPKLPNKTLLSALFDSKVTVELLAGPQLQSVGLRLTPGHVIRFQGTLTSPSLGALKTFVDLTALECLSCQPDDDDDQHTSDQPEDTSSFEPTVWPDTAHFAASTLQGVADFVLPHFIRLNVTQLIWSS